MIRAQNSVAVKEKMDEVGLITSVGKMPISQVKITKNGKRAFSTHKPHKALFP